MRRAALPLKLSLVMLCLGLAPPAEAQMPRPGTVNRPPPATFRNSRRPFPTPEEIEEEIARDPLRPGTYVRAAEPPAPNPLGGSPIREVRRQDGYPMATIGPANGPASVIPRVPVPGQIGAGIPPRAPWTPGAVGLLGQGPTVPGAEASPRISNIFDPIGCPQCGGAVQHRANAILIGPGGELQNVAPIIPNPGVAMPTGGLQHNYQQCIGCGARREDNVTTRGEINLAPLLQRRQATVDRLNSYCPSGTCTHLLHGEAALPSPTGQMYYGTSVTCIGCGASSQTVHQGETTRIVVTPNGVQIPQGPVRANGLPGWPLNTNHMVDPTTAARAGSASTQALIDAWNSYQGR